MHALAETPVYDLHDNVEKKIQTFGTTFTNITNSILAYDGPYPFPTEPFPCNARSSVEINVAPRPVDYSALSFDVQASVDTTEIDTAKGFGFAKVDFQIVVNLSKDAYISGSFDRNSSTNRGGIRLLYGSYLQGSYASPGSPVQFPQDEGVLRAGSYIIDVYLYANPSDPLPRQQEASATFNFNNVSSNNVSAPALPPTPSDPVGSGDSFIYYESLPDDSPYLANLPDQFRRLFTQAKGHPWISSYLYNLQYHYLDGGAFYEYQYFESLLNTNWLVASADPRLLYSAPNADEPPDYYYFTSFSVSTPFTGSYQPDGSMSAYGPLGLDASGGLIEISASYDFPAANPTIGSAFGFMLRIDVDEKGAILEYSTSPQVQPISTFRSGEPLSEGSYFFGIAAGDSGISFGYPYPGFERWVGSATLSMFRIPTPAPNPPPQITSVFRSSGNFTLQWADDFNRAVHIQRSTDLSSTNWQTVQSNVSTKIFTDTNTPNGSAFYRLLVP